MYLNVCSFTLMLLQTLMIFFLSQNTIEVDAAVSHTIRVKQSLRTAKLQKMSERNMFFVLDPKFYD